MGGRGEMNNLIILYGPTGSGKTKWQNYFIHNYACIDLYGLTTREKRNELEKGYWFVTNQLFQEYLESNQLINVNKYQNEFYGIHIQNFKNSFFISKKINKPIICISDISSLNRFQKEIQEIIKPKKIKVYCVYCQPPPNYLELLQQRGSYDRMEIVEKEIEEHNEMKHLYNISNENEADKFIQDKII